MGFRVKTDNRWKDGIIPYEFSEEAGKTIPKDSKVREIVIACMRRWEDLVADPSTNTFYIRFRPREANEKPYLLITGDKGFTSGAIGLTDVRSGASNLIIGYLTFINAIPHELGHVIGLYHENERNVTPIAKNKYDPKIGPLLCPVPGSLADNPKSGMIAADVKDGNRVTDDSEYDIWSIMHYPSMKGNWEYNCTTEQMAAYFGVEHQELLDRFNENPDSKHVLNYPSTDEVKEGHWGASPGDSAAVRRLYKQQ